MLRARVFYEVLDPNSIFGMVGRCGGGYNTVWEDWTPEGRIAREKITEEYEAGLDKICGHYAKLEESVLKEGFRTPLIVTFGKPHRKRTINLPPELRSSDRLFVLEGVTGGSRLWVAQKHNIPVPCIVNDFTGIYIGTTPIVNTQQAATYFKEFGSNIRYDTIHGIVETFDNSKVGSHLGPEWSEDIIVKQRAPLWVSIMNKYGYYVDRLQPYVLDILKNAGVVQPENLKRKFNGSRA